MCFEAKYFFVAEDLFNMLIAQKVALEARPV